jgi:hypothetical protein
VSRKVYEKRYELTFRDHGAKKTGNNSVRFTGDDPTAFVKTVLPIVTQALKTWVKEAKAGR